ncbi:Minf_1886 family protein [Botrimarina hoheduenensis]|uniref:Uncharacterized protein n=1 Tax=Botrimarina hoheduenensis TaxID=2528000 RepID=A0A5C5W8X0_9BACT|nr:Minf_1886 family protein [Botrimarina hoheduenensis]TWT46713.1 hypothetical protein Pla111_18140 [Botrimarina hoheduenensis]
MLDPKHPLAELLRRDNRYEFEAYVFVFDALRYGQEQMGLGQPNAADYEEDDDQDDAESGEADDEAERHVSGQELCWAIRQYALNQYGLLAKNVLAHWGVTNTGDFGEIVFNLIDIGQMRKTEEDRREDFDNVFDFVEAFNEQCVFTLGEDELEEDDDE